MNLETKFLNPFNILKIMTVFEKVKKEDLEFLKEKGFQPEEPKSVYEELRLTKQIRNKNLILILYTSGKLLLQGSQKEKERLAEQLKKAGINKEIKTRKFRPETGWIIGSDESLKGDTFGGLVVAAVKANNQTRKKLEELGVADSKKLADKEILLMAERIRALVGCQVISIYPEEYNQNELTPLLNRLHQECYRYLQPGKHIVDKYPGCTVGDLRVEKAEDKYLEVAAASVLARAAALRQLDSLSLKAGFHLPKGSTHVKLALHELKERGLDFKQFVKVGFNNVQEFL